MAPIPNNLPTRVQKNKQWERAEGKERILGVMVVGNEDDDEASHQGKR